MKIVFYLATAFLMLSLGLLFYSLMGFLMNKKDKDVRKKQGRNAIICLVAAVIFYLVTTLFIGK